MYGKSVLALALLPELIAARSVGHAFSRRSVDCTFTIAASSGDTCETFADSWGITTKELKSINPDLDCAKFDDNAEYCVSGEANDDEPTKTTASSNAAETTTTVTTSSSTETTKTPTTTSSTSDHEPTQPGLAENCDNFHKVSDGDSCYNIEASAGITHSQFLKWNPYINESMFPHLHSHFFLLQLS
jgi:LysM repeat protein